MTRARPLLLILPLAWGCGLDDGKVEVRACNLTGYDVAELEYAGIDVGDLADRTCSAYAESPYQEVYDYTSVSLVIGADPFVLQPVDYLGDDPLPAGRWSYEITVRDYDNRLLDVRAVR